MTNDRRRFTRIPFQSPARLNMPEGEFAVDMVDISFKGALIRPGTGFFATIGTNGHLDILLDELEVVIRMEVTIVHRQSGLCGLACREMDLDSLTHLRRLVELNLGDEAALNRELTALAAQDA